ncbi:MAG: hypothetical protein EA376_12230 [Phycisphaeraceae bacterium]|nr:MAG: hypothetical protein EA376_12230 [Phycisphaeraceae bacterium]
MIVFRSDPSAGGVHLIMDMEAPRAHSSHETGVQGAPSVRCVVVARGGAPSIPPDLLASLKRHGVEVVPCADIFNGLAKAMLLHQSAAPDAGPSPTAVLVVEPEQTARSFELVESIQRFAPRIAVWRYDADASPKLRGFQSERSNRKNETPSSVDTATRTVPALRLTGVDEQDGALHFKLAHDDDHGAQMNESETGEEGEQERPSDLLSAEELAMLLSDDPPTPERGGRRP